MERLAFSTRQICYARDIGQREPREKRSAIDRKWAIIASSEPH
jgi:hypothetical protein